MMGYIILVTVDSAKIKYMAVYFSALGAYPLGPFFLAWGMNNAAGATIRAVASAYIVSVGTFGGILATWTYLVKDAPDYLRGHYINIGCQAALTCIGVLGIGYVRWENGVRVRGGRDGRVQGLSEVERRRLGYRNPEFRYVE